MSRIDRFRPWVHFTPEANWMNDPNGCIYHNGVYHLFYQYHPGSKQWGPMHWGHAISRNLLDWEHQPVALYPDENLGAAFSGSAVHDSANVSGLFLDKQGLMAFYTTHLEKGEGQKPLQQQCMAYSSDQGKTWVPYHANPIIPNPGYDDFRDPKVFYHKDSEHWVMVLVARQQVCFYRSPDLLSWTPCGTFAKYQGHDEVVWECPDLMSLPDDQGQTHWVLFVSCVTPRDQPFVPMQYFVGHFDGCTFTESQPNDVVNRVDQGPDFYAAQSFHGTTEHDGRTIWIAWVNHWSYADKTPADCWRGMMSLPRELSLVVQDGRAILRQQVIGEFKSGLVNAGQHFGAGEVLLANPNAAQWIDLAIPIATAQPVCLAFKNSTGETLSLNWDPVPQLLTVDRTGIASSAFDELFNQRQSVSLSGELAGMSVLDVTIVIDRCSIEIFALGGRVVMTLQVFPEQAFDRVLIVADHDVSLQQAYFT